MAAVCQRSTLPTFLPYLIGVILIQSGDLGSIDKDLHRAAVGFCGMDDGETSAGKSEGSGIADGLGVMEGVIDGSAGDIPEEPIAVIDDG